MDFTSRASVDICFVLHSLLVCQDRVLLLSKCLSRRVYKACRCCLEDVVSSMSTDKTTENTCRGQSRCWCQLPTLSCHPIVPRGCCELCGWGPTRWAHPGLYVPLILVLGNCGLAGRRAGHLYQLWATVATVSTLWPASFADKLLWCRTAHRAPGSSAISSLGTAPSCEGVRRGKAHRPCA